MVSLPDGRKISKISFFVLAQLRNVMDRRTDRHRVTALAALCVASHGKNWHYLTNISLYIENGTRYAHTNRKESMCDLLNCTISSDLE